MNRNQRVALFEKELYPQIDALYNFAYYLTLNAETSNDLVQDTFMKAYRFIDSYQEGTNAKTWLFRILKNAFINDYRKKVKRPFQVDYENYLSSHSGEKATLDTSTANQQDPFKEMLGDEVTRAINELPVDFRTVIILCDLEDFSYDEIAKIVDIPVGTVRSRLHRARNLLKEKLKEYASKKGFNQNN